MLAGLRRAGVSTLVTLALLAPTALASALGAKNLKATVQSADGLGDATHA